MRYANKLFDAVCVWNVFGHDNEKLVLKYTKHSQNFYALFSKGNKRTMKQYWNDNPGAYIRVRNYLTSK